MRTEEQIKQIKSLSNKDFNKLMKILNEQEQHLSLIEVIEMRFKK